MKVNRWLAIRRNGACRVTARKPGLDWDEVAICLDIELPDALFRKPRLEARIVVPDEAAASETISAAVTENVKDAIEQATGLTFAIRVIREEDEAGP